MSSGWSYPNSGRGNGRGRGNRGGYGPGRGGPGRGGQNQRGFGGYRNQSGQNRYRSRSASPSGNRRSQSAGSFVTQKQVSSMVNQAMTKSNSGGQAKPTSKTYTYTSTSAPPGAPGYTTQLLKHFAESSIKNRINELLNCANKSANGLTVDLRQKYVFEFSGYTVGCSTIKAFVNLMKALGKMELLIDFIPFMQIGGEKYWACTDIVCDQAGASCDTALYKSLGLNYSTAVYRTLQNLCVRNAGESDASLKDRRDEMRKQVEKPIAEYFKVGSEPMTAQRLLANTKKAADGDSSGIGDAGPKIPKPKTAVKVKFGGSSASADSEA